MAFEGIRRRLGLLRDATFWREREAHALALVDEDEKFELREIAAIRRHYQRDHGDAWFKEELERARAANRVRSLQELQPRLESLYGKALTIGQVLNALKHDEVLKRLGMDRRQAELMAAEWESKAEEQVAKKDWQAVSRRIEELRSRLHEETDHISVALSALEHEERRQAELVREWKGKGITGRTTFHRLLSKSRALRDHHLRHQFQKRVRDFFTQQTEYANIMSSRAEEIRLYRSRRDFLLDALAALEQRKKEFLTVFVMIEEGTFRDATEFQGHGTGRILSATRALEAKASSLRRVA